MRPARAVRVSEKKLIEGEAELGCIGGIVNLIQTRDLEGETGRGVRRERRGTFKCDAEGIACAAGPCADVGNVGLQLQALATAQKVAMQPRPGEGEAVKAGNLSPYGIAAGLLFADGGGDPRKIGGADAVILGQGDGRKDAGPAQAGICRLPSVDADGDHGGVVAAGVKGVQDAGVIGAGGGEEILRMVIPPESKGLRRRIFSAR